MNTSSEITVVVIVLLIVLLIVFFHIVLVPFLNQKKSEEDAREAEETKAEETTRTRSVKEEDAREAEETEAKEITRTGSVKIGPKSTPKTPTSPPQKKGDLPYTSILTFDPPHGTRICSQCGAEAPRDGSARIPCHVCGHRG